MNYNAFITKMKSQKPFVVARLPNAIQKQSVPVAHLPETLVNEDD